MCTHISMARDWIAAIERWAIDGDSASRHTNVYFILLMFKFSFIAFVRRSAAIARQAAITPRTLCCCSYSYWDFGSDYKLAAYKLSTLSAAEELLLLFIWIIILFFETLICSAMNTAFIIIYCSIDDIFNVWDKCTERGAKEAKGNACEWITMNPFYMTTWAAFEYLFFSRMISGVTVMSGIWIVAREQNWWLATVSTKSRSCLIDWNPILGRAISRILFYAPLIHHKHLPARNSARSWRICFSSFSADHRIWKWSDRGCHRLQSLRLQWHRCHCQYVHRYSRQ